MSNLVRSAADSPVSEFFRWLDLNRPSRLSDVTHYIPVESYTDNGRYVVRADLPGVDPEKDIEVNLEGDLLTIHGERREEEHDKGHSEVRYGSFTRTVRLPKDADPNDVTARYDSGVLVVSMPMAEPQTEPVKIAVQRSEGGPS